MWLARWARGSAAWITIPQVQIGRGASTFVETNSSGRYTMVSLSCARWAGLGYMRSHEYGHQADSSRTQWGF